MAVACPVFQSEQQLQLQLQLVDLRSNVNILLGDLVPSSVLHITMRQTDRPPDALLLGSPKSALAAAAAAAVVQYVLC